MAAFSNALNMTAGSQDPDVLDYYNSTIGFNYTWICINLNNNGPCADLAATKIIIP